MAVETIIKSRYIVLHRLVELMDELYPLKWSQEVRISIRAISVNQEKEVMLTGLQSSGDLTKITAPEALTMVYSQTSQRNLP
jgi:hypothetical protein